MTLFYKNVEGTFLGREYYARRAAASDTIRWALFDRSTESFSLLTPVTGVALSRGQGAWTKDGIYLAHCDSDIVGVIKRDKDQLVEVTSTGTAVSSGNSNGSVAWSKDGSFFIYGGGLTNTEIPRAFTFADDTLVNEGKCTNTSATGEISRVVLADNDRFLLTGKFNIGSTANPYIQIFEQDAATPYFYNELVGGLENNTGLGSVPNSVQTCDISVNGNYVAWYQSGGASPVVRIWERTGDLTWAIAHDEPATGSLGASSLQFTPDEKFLYFLLPGVGTATVKAYCFDLSDFSKVTLPSGIVTNGLGTSPVTDVTFSNDSEYMFVSTQDLPTRIFKLDSVNGGISYEAPAFSGWPDFGTGTETLFTLGKLYNN